jgi:hypothetical protein
MEIELKKIANCPSATVQFSSFLQLACPASAVPASHRNFGGFYLGLLSAGFRISDWRRGHLSPNVTAITS